MPTLYPMKKYRYIFFVLLFSVGISCAVYSQKEPPPPTQNAPGGGHGPPCDPGSVSGNPNRPGVPPPPGLCLPIDDYVYLLMAVGVMYGCYKMKKFDLTK